jgi:hypothetical protein
MNYKQLLKQGNYLTANKIIAKKIGLLESILLSTILDVYDYRKKGGFVTSDGYFQLSQADIEEETTMTRRQQDTAILKLKQAGLIDVKLIGVPATRHFVLCENFNEIIDEICSENELGCTNKNGEIVQTSLADSYKLESTNRTNSITKTKSITKSINQCESVSDFDYKKWVMENYTNQIIIEKYLKYLGIRKRLKCKTTETIMQRDRREFEKAEKVENIYELLDKADERGWKELKMEYIQPNLVQNNQKKSAYIKN